MNVGKTLFVQVMEFVPWKTFGRIVERRKDDADVHALSCANLFKKELQLNASLYTCLQILSVSIFEKTEVSSALQPDRSQRAVATAAN